MRNAKTRGFTLIELMIVLAVISIISSIAYGSYQNSVRKAKRAEAKTALMELAQRMERCYTANGNYSNACSVHDGADLKTDLQTTEKGNYTLAFTAAPTASTFSITATPTFDDPGCTSFTITDTGAKTATGTDTCW